MKPQARRNWQDQWAAQPRRAMLFDLDGTLLDSAPDLAKAANVLRQRSNLPPMPVEELRPWVSQGARGMITKGLNIPVDHPEYEPLRLAFLDIYSECLADNTDFWPGMDQVVDALDAQQIAWGIVTNKVMRFTEPLLKQINLWERCAVVVGGDTTPHAKPHPAPMVHAIETLALPPQAVVYVGDDARDIESGYAAGTWTIGCDFGHHVQAPWPHEWGADAVVKQAQDLIRLL